MKFMKVTGLLLTPAILTSIITSIEISADAINSATTQESADSNSEYQKNTNAAFNSKIQEMIINGTSTQVKNTETTHIISATGTPATGLIIKYGQGSLHYTVQFHPIKSNDTILSGIIIDNNGNTQTFSYTATGSVHLENNSINVKPALFTAKKYTKKTKKSKKSKLSDAYMTKLTGFTWKHGKMQPSLGQVGQSIGNAFINSIHPF